jgi:hypothetical protein
MTDALLPLALGEIVIMGDGMIKLMTTPHPGT